VELFASVDLGATSGRVSVGWLTSGQLMVNEVHRFHHEATRDTSGALRWQWQKIINEIKKGLTIARSRGEVISVGIDTWASDYGLLDEKGTLLENPYCYRDARTDGVMERVSAQLGREYIYHKTGIQYLFFNTAYQLVAASQSRAFSKAEKFLMLPDLLNNQLCGSTTNEITNASTTQLLNVRSRAWDWELIEKLNLPRRIFPVIHGTGDLLGVIRGYGELDGIRVVAVASHDTASAIAGIPLNSNRKSAYISSGTWSLMGLELDHPVTNERSMNFNITNELGAGNKVRFLRNITGMWLLEESVRYWKTQGIEVTVPELVIAAANLPVGRQVIDTNDPRFSKPGPMPVLIADFCRESGQPIPVTPPEIARCIFDSLALAYRKVLSQLESAAGVTIDEINIVGGGSTNALLNQLTANSTEKRVFAGPAEATVLGNLIIQMLSAGHVSSLQEGRESIARSIVRSEFRPIQDTDWNSLALRIQV